MRRFFLAATALCALAGAAVAQDSPGAYVPMRVVPPAAAVAAADIQAETLSIEAARLTGIPVSDVDGVSAGIITEIQSPGLGMPTLAVIGGPAQLQLSAPLSDLTFAADFSSARLTRPVVDLGIASTGTLVAGATPVLVRREVGAGGAVALPAPVTVMADPGLIYYEPDDLIGRGVTDMGGTQLGVIDGVVGGLEGLTPDRLVIRSEGMFSSVSGLRTLPLDQVHTTPQGSIETNAWADSALFSYDGSTRVFAR